MIRILVYIALVFAAAAGFAWLADRPGEITLAWQGYQVSTSLMVAAVAIAAAFVLVAIVLSILMAVLRAPSLLDGWLTGRRRDRGYRSLSRGMIAMGAGDIKKAKRHSAEARKILDGEPLTLLLAAQTAQAAGDGAGARAAFEAMLPESETRLLGLRGLYVEAERAGEHEAARHYAEEAVKAAPSLGWAGEALFTYQSSAGDWRGALQTLGSNLQAKLVDKTSAHRLRAVLLTAHGLELETGSPHEALAAALEAVRLAPGLVPAATLAARLAARQNDIKRAMKVLEAAWKQEPHPELAEAYLSVRPGDGAGDRLKRAQKLADLRPTSPESAFVVARAAIDAREWPEARRALAKLPDSGQTERYWLLMAEIEDGAEGDRGRVREYLGRAVRAPRDPVWMADGYAFNAWAPLSPVSGRLDSFEWRTPSMALSEDPRPLLNLDLTPAAPATEAEEEPSPALAPMVIEATPAPKMAANGTETPKTPPPPLPDDPGIDDGRPETVDRLRLQ
ncbi:MAG TPA: heme biosynthesis HemY N-terminal domain-containing protein [Kaistia sp.]|nr:heme biosynthesis HemY N-terminal domain-containing protein [Kaistia sp.]